MELSEFRPHPMLVTRETEMFKPRFPVFDAHNHLGSEFGGGWDKRPVNELLDILDEAGVQHIVDLDGGWGEDILYRHLDHIKVAAPERFIMYGGIEWDTWNEHGDHFGEWAANRLRTQVARGAQGLKVWKNFGLHVRDQRGELGRQPYSARRFFLKYADRILFGLDSPVNAIDYRIYYRFLETDDENFAYGSGLIPRQGRWRVHGLYLPDDVLEKVYFRNAERLILHKN